MSEFAQRATSFLLTDTCYHICKCAAASLADDDDDVIDEDDPASDRTAMFLTAIGGLGAAAGLGLLAHNAFKDSTKNIGVPNATAPKIDSLGAGIATTEAAIDRATPWRSLSVPEHARTMLRAIERDPKAELPLGVKPQPIDALGTAWGAGRALFGGGAKRQGVEGFLAQLRDADTPAATKDSPGWTHRNARRAWNLMMGNPGDTAMARRRDALEAAINYIKTPEAPVYGSGGSGKGSAPPPDTSLADAAKSHGRLRENLADEVSSSSGGTNAKALRRFTTQLEDLLATPTTDPNAAIARQRLDTMASRLGVAVYSNDQSMFPSGTNKGGSTPPRPGARLTDTSGRTFIYDPNATTLASQYRNIQRMNQGLSDFANAPNPKAGITRVFRRFLGPVILMQLVKPAAGAIDTALFPSSVPIEFKDDR